VRRLLKSLDILTNRHGLSLRLWRDLLGELHWAPIEGVLNPAGGRLAPSRSSLGAPRVGAEILAIRKLGTLQAGALPTTILVDEIR